MPILNEMEVICVGQFSLVTVVMRKYLLIQGISHDFNLNDCWRYLKSLDEFKSSGFLVTILYEHIAI